MDEMKHEHHEHAHEHNHSENGGHTHTHGGDHQHSHHGNGSREEALALLRYMTDHNRHHAEELHDLAHHFDPKTADLIHEALKDLNAGNDKLAEALKAAAEA